MIISTKNKTLKKTLFIISILAFQSLLAQVQTYPARMWADTTHAPFLYGVASGDPDTSAVWLWTRIEPTPGQDSLPVRWEISETPDFGSPADSGTEYAHSGLDFTVKVRAAGLMPGRSYYYRFLFQTFISDTGRSRTLPSGTTNSVKLAVLSCSSIYSGYFNGYRHLAENATADFCVHLGDYIYEYPDADERVRMPDPAPSVPNDLASWRERHKYYLLDPDLRAARKSMPWITLWDNHDINNSNGANPSPGSMQAFREYLPIRNDSLSAQNIIYRSFDFGNLLRLNIADILLYRTFDTLSDGSFNILGNAQFDRICSQLKSSDKIWNVMGGQKMFGGWYTYGIPDLLLNLVPNDGPVFSDNGWDGFIPSRNRLIDTLRTYNINNFVSIAGDAHFSVAMDVVKDPRDLNEYDPVSGAGAAGMDFLPTSISRGNFDESGIPPSLMPNFYDFSNQANPHHVYFEGIEHGYGLLEFSPDSLIAHYLYFPVRQPSGNISFQKRLKAVAGQNHWLREQVSNTDVINEDGTASLMTPNPATEYILVKWEGDLLQAKMIEAGGKLAEAETEVLNATSAIWNIGKLSPGVYVWVGLTTKGSYVKKFIKQ